MRLIQDNMHFPFITEDWCADEEQLLLEGLELYGYGNWEDVAEYVTTKDKKQCEEHYKTVYEKSPKWPEPVRICPA
jgi:transcriptional adapter 2-alpha